jgi:hypothetical protein
MDPIVMAFIQTFPERKYDALVKKRLEIIRLQFTNKQYSSALQLFIDLRKDLLDDDFW